jgi:2-polyprenyl-3-methyl-5-hydroxy-6-metoxy-1,4-benzoquinol methylase
MNKNEKKSLNKISNWYIDQQLDFDKVLINYRFEKLKKFFIGEKCLELGPAEGEMTKKIVNEFKSVTVVDAADDLLNKIPNYSNLNKINSLFEEFNTKEKFDTIIIDHVLEHVDDPVWLLKMSSNLLNNNGRILIGVPNANSIHRLVAVKMNILNNQCDLNERDLAVGHRRVYTKETMQKDIFESGLKIIESGGIFFKPLSNSQIQKNWTNEMIEGFYKLGDDFQDFSAELYVICSN